MWNDEFQTMESTVFGHPGAPRGENWLPKDLLPFTQGRFGLTFEEEGVRARARLRRAD